MCGKSDTIQQNFVGVSACVSECVSVYLHVEIHGTRSSTIQRRMHKSTMSKRRAWVKSGGIHEAQH